MKAHIVKFSLGALLPFALSACVVAPVQPVGYRVTSDTLPTYVDGQYVGSQPSVYTQPVTPVYTTPAYTYPYYAPVYVDPYPWLGVGLGIGIGVNYFRGGCCWRGGYRGWGGGYRGGRRWR